MITEVSGSHPEENGLGVLLEKTARQVEKVITGGKKAVWLAAAGLAQTITDSNLLNCPGEINV